MRATPRATRRRQLAEFLRELPVVGPLARSVYRQWFVQEKPFEGSKQYWVRRYDEGGDSGVGSFAALAAFKAEIVNEFVRENNVRSVIEFGCGDGSQLTLARYPAYVGVDVSPEALRRCSSLFEGDNSKTFMASDDYCGVRAELSLSLDVIYHLVENAVFDSYMCRLFDAAERFVIVYSSDMDENSEGQAPHVRHRAFSRWVAERRPAWKLSRHIPNRYPVSSYGASGSFAEFFVFAKSDPRGAV